MPVTIRTTDAEIDPNFCCRLCGLNAYMDGALERTEHPGKPGRALYWINSKLCDCCYDELEVYYRHDPWMNKLEQIKELESAPERLADFKKALAQSVKACLSAHRALLGSTERGVRVNSGEQYEKLKIAASAVFYSEKNWPAHLGDKSAYTPGTEGGQKGYYVFDLPPDAVPRANFE